MTGEGGFEEVTLEAGDSDEAVAGDVLGTSVDEPRVLIDHQVGPREQGPAALEFFTEVKAVYVDYTGQARKGSLY